MSRIYFHQRNGEDVEIRGAERAYFGISCQNLAHSIVVDYWNHTPELEHPLMRFMDQRSKEDLIPPLVHEDHARRFAQAERNFRYVLSGLRQTMLTFNGETMHAMDAALNTVIAMGSPRLAFMAKVHGTCESHGWIDDTDREYFAAVIHNARTNNMFRRNMGWEQLWQALDEGSGPVVMSYSVTDGFPDRPERIEEDAWYSLDDEERFDIALDELKVEPWLQMTEDNLLEQGFAAGWSLFDLMDSSEWRAGSGLADKET